MHPFPETASFKRLAQLAKEAPDLTKSMSAERIAKMFLEKLGMKLLFATERVDESILADLEHLAKERGAALQMRAMQSGEVINRIEGYESEERRVLHTAMRDLSGGKGLPPPVQEASQAALTELNKLKSFLDHIGDRFTDLVQVGIGGSDLGPRALYLALQRYGVKERRIHFISNVDPDDAALVMKDLDLRRTLVVVVSKSGSTLETATNEALVASFFTQAGLKPKEHFVAVTGKGSPMDDPAKYLASFYIWDYIGGRYSATSMVGGVMLAFGLGYESWLEILKGAHEMDRHALTENLHQNLPLLAALLGIWNRNFLGHHTCAVIPYSQALTRFPAHLQQLDMESNGKGIDRHGHAVSFATGPIIWGEVGTNGQHSFYQSIHQGTTVVPIEFLGFRHAQYGKDLEFEGSTCQQKLIANLLAQSLALATGQKSSNPNKNFAGNRPTSILLMDRLDPHTMGKLLAYYEHKVAFQGMIWGINSFDQEGVQLGKKLALSVLDEMKSKKKAFALGEAMLRHL